jgi:predicted Zn-dependent peptidase
VSTSDAAKLVADQPRPGDPRPWQFPSFERREVAGGRLITCHLPGRPLAVLSLVSTAGATTEPAGQEGVALLLAEVLSEGTPKLDAYEFAVASERLGAVWRAHADWDSLRCGFEVPVQHLAEAADLLAQAVHTPATDDATVLRVRDERVDEMALERSQPAARAAVAFADALFADGSRYRRLDGGDPDTVAALTPDDVRGFAQRRLTPDSTTAILVGDLETVDIDAVGAALFDGWTATAEAVADPVVALRAPGRRAVLVDRPGSLQSALYVGHDGISRRVPDYVAATTMSLVFGGMFNSRLNMKLREEKGYSYGARGAFEARRHGGTFGARSAVQSEVTAPALADLVAEIDSVHTGNITADELEIARSYRAGIFPINFATAGAVAAGIGDLVVHDLPDDHFDRLRQQVIDIELDAVNEAARTRIRPDDLVTVVVGDAAAIASDLEPLGLGAIDIVSD